MTELIKEKILDGIEDRYLSEAADHAKIHKVEKQRLISALGRMAACLAIIIGLSISSLSIAVAAGNMAAYDVLYAIYPDIAVKLMPISASCEDGGIRMGVEGMSIQDSCAYVYISMHDPEGKYIDKSIDLFDSYSIHTNADQIGGCTLVDFDEVNRKATFLITVQNMDGTPIEGSAMTFSVSRFLTGKNETQEELTQISPDAIFEVTETQREEGLNIRGGSHTDGYAVEGMKQEYLCVDESKLFVPTPGVTVTNYGFVNNKLHVQVYYENIVQFDDHGYIYLVGGDGKEILPESSIAFWDEEGKGSYEEYIFDISADKINQYAIYGHFFTCRNLVEGDWKVSFTIEDQN